MNEEHEISSSSRGGVLGYWPLLLGPLAAAIVVVLGRFEWSFDFYIPAMVDNDYTFVRTHWELSRLDARLEEVAPWLILIPTALYWIRAIATRNPLYMILTGMAASLLCREIHFDGMDKAIYVLGVVVVVWLIAWRDILVDPLKDARHKRWLIATMATYLLSQIIARRAFKSIPGEAAIHCYLEEGVETAGHLMMIVTSLVGNWRRYNKSKV